MKSNASQKLTDIYHDLRQVPPQHLDEIHKVIQSLIPPRLSNEELVVEMHKILNGTDELSSEEWDEINAHMRQVRAELFTRPNPFMEDEADAA